MAAGVDLEVWRNFCRTMNLLEPPSTLMQPEFLTQVIAAPTRAEMFAQLKVRGLTPQ
jgi:hypothetical protein